MTSKSKGGKRTEAIHELIKLREKADKLPPLSVAEERMIKGRILVESVYSSARLEGSKLTKEEVENISASDA